MRKGDVEQARALYQGLEHDGLKDASQRAHVDRQLETLVGLLNDEAALDRVNRGDEARAKQAYQRARSHYEAALTFGLPTDAQAVTTKKKLADVDMVLLGEVDQVALVLVDELAGAGCDHGTLADASFMLSQPMSATASIHVKSLVASCVDKIGATPQGLSYVLSALQRASTNHPEWSLQQHKLIAQVLLAGLQDKDPEQAYDWLQAAARDQRWQSAPEAEAIETQRIKAAARVIDALAASASASKPSCMELMTRQALHFSTHQERVGIICGTEIDQFLDAMESATSLDAHLNTLMSVARHVPLNTTQLARLQRLLDGHASPWKSRAASASTPEAQVVYATIADSIDHRGSARAELSTLKSHLQESLRPSRVVVKPPEISGTCTSSVQSMLRSAPGGSKGSEPVTSLTSSLRCSYEVSAVELNRNVSNVVTSQECKTFEIKTRSNAGFKCLETRSASTGQNVSDCRYGYNSRTKTKAETYEICSSETATIVTYGIQVCVNASIKGSATLRGPGGETISSNDESFEANKCTFFEDTVPSGTESTPEQERAHVMSSLAFSEAQLIQDLFEPLKQPVVSYVERETRRLQKEHQARIRKDLSSTSLDERIRGAVHQSMLNETPYAEQETLKGLVPDALLLSELQGEARPALRARVIQDLWSPPAPQIATLQDPSIRLKRFNEVVEDYQEPSPKVHVMTSLPARAMTSTSWLSTGPHQHSNVGATTVWGDKIERSDLLLEVNVGWARELIDTRTTPQLAWNAMGLFGRIGVGAGMKLDTFGGLTRGGQVSARWIGAHAHDRGRLEPQVSWSAGVIADWTRLEHGRALSLRVPMIVSTPVLPKMSFDVGLEPDLVHLFSMDAPLGMAPHAARSMAWVGTTWSLWQSRLALHASLGPSFNASRTDLLTGRTTLHFRF